MLLRSAAKSDRAGKLGLTICQIATEAVVTRKLCLKGSVGRRKRNLVLRAMKAN